MEDFNSNCYLTDNKKIIKFVPEKQIKLLEYEQTLWKRIFPQKNNIDLTKLKLTNIGIYSASKEEDIIPLIKYLKQKYGSLKNKVIIDGNGGVGNTTLFLSYDFGLVICVEIQKEHYDVIKNNIKVYNRQNVKMLNYDFFDVALNLKSNFVLFDLPWGGRNFKKSNKLKLGYNNINIVCIINKLIEKKNIIDGIILFCPYNFDIENFKNKINSKNIHTIKLKKHYWIIISF